MATQQIGSNTRYTPTNTTHEHADAACDEADEILDVEHENTVIVWLRHGRGLLTEALNTVREHVPQIQPK